MPALRITHPEVPEPPPRTWSNCLVVGNQVFVAGMTARNGGDILADDEYGQAWAVFDKIAKLLEAAGASMGDVVKLVIYVTDISRREEVWRARREFFAGEFPVSTLVEVSALAMPALKVEIEAVAVCTG
ncbi:MAG: Rid family hydrolase [Alphaproteobacteria bacterium]|nr:Rid family hydrolase [Alphaproteobacteria bacterium]